MSGRGRGGRGRGRGGAGGGRGRGRPSGSSGRGNGGTTGGGILRETGKRSGVVVDVESALGKETLRDADGLLDEDRLFASAREPTETSRQSSSSSSESPPSRSRALPAKHGRSIRFSLADEQQDERRGGGSSSVPPASSERRPRKQSAAQVPPPSVLRRRVLPFAANRAATPSSLSPGALSRASTAPSDPFYDSDDTHEDDEPDNAETDEEVTAEDPVDEGEDEPSAADVVAHAQRKDRGSTEGDAPSRPVERREDSTDRGDVGDYASPSDPEHHDEAHRDFDVEAVGRDDHDAPLEDDDHDDEEGEEEDHDDLAPNPPSPDEYDHVLGRGDSPDPELDADDTPAAEADDRGHGGDNDGEAEEEVDFPPAEDGYENDDDDDDGGDDKEGPGYHMSGDPGSGEEDENENEDSHLGGQSSARGKRPNALASSDSSEGDDNNRHTASKQAAKKGSQKLRVQETEDDSASSSEDDAPRGSTKMRSHKRSTDSSSEDEREAQTKKPNKDRTDQKQKKKRKQKGSSRSDDEADRRRKKRNQKGTIARKPVFTPKGIPLQRTYNTVPVSDLKETRDGTLRRSQRARIKPLEFWRNEGFNYGPNDEFDGPQYDSLRNMPVPKGVRFAEPTPYKPRAPPKGAPTKGSKKSKGSVSAGNRHKRNGRGESSDDDEYGDRRRGANAERPPFDFSKLRKKRVLMQGDEALVWDDTEQNTANLKVVSHQEDLRPRTLPQTHARRPDESDLLGSAAQAFNVSNADSDHYPGYLMGNLVLPPRAIKDPEAVGNCAQTFTVVRSQPKALEVSYGNPDVDEGILHPGEAQSFFLGAGDMFRVPPGNCYRLENHSRVDDCLLTWTILRTLQEPE